MAAERAGIVVTGAAGFIGARLAARLIAEGERVIAVDTADYFTGRTQIADLYRKGPAAGIVDRDEFFGWLEKAPPLQAILHMGACTDTAETDEGYLAQINTAYTRRLWEWAAAKGVPLYYASSAAVYGAGEEDFDDDAPPENLSPLNPYGWSKLRFDAWALTEGQALRPPKWAGFRFFNVYGYAEAHKGPMASVLNTAFRDILEKGSIRLFRSHKEGIPDGHQKRDFVFVDDVVDLLCHVLRKGVPDGIYNLGTGEARTFLHLAHAAFAALGREPNVVFFDTPPEIRPRYQYFTQAKMDKLRRAGYAAPFLSIEEGTQRYWERLKGELIPSR
ncbi:MAG: ADP-glyceromanno-heptose 6-epimerase [bacterium]|nr:ADP-glyceromanno-heptose 6-epimerase [bacterium]